MVARADAAVVRANLTLDEADSQLGREAAAASTGKTGVVKKLFGMAPSDLARRACRNRCEHTKNIVVANITELGPSHPLAGWAGLIGALASRARGEPGRSLRSRPLLGMLVVP